MEGWRSVGGLKPSIVTSVNYSGEPSLNSSAPGDTPQMDFANRSFVAGLSEVSFQVVMRGSNDSASYFGLSTSSDTFVAVVGIRGGSQVVAGKDLSHLKTVEQVPQNTSQPAGWIYIIANVFKNNNGNWKMKIFVDRTDILAGEISVPDAGSYTGALIDTVNGTFYYTDIAVSSTLITNLVPKWNNMEGYGQGGACLCSSLNVKLLPAFDNLTADMTLQNWSVPQNNILSFQINNSNETGATIPRTCIGFFQIGVDFDQNGYIAPWYVKGDNCVAHYFAGQGGVASPPGTRLTLSIVLDSSTHSLKFVIVDYSISRTFSASVPYYGGAFDSMFTQLEFQPCCNTSSISVYRMNGAISIIGITTTKGMLEFLGSNYMIPWSVDAPPNWDFTYYNNATDGYAQSSS